LNVNNRQLKQVVPFAPFLMVLGGNHLDEHEKRLVLQGIIIGAHSVCRIDPIYGEVGARISNYADAWGVNDHVRGLTELCAEICETLDFADASDVSRLPEHNN
jgi:hypothetical protein